MQKDIQEFIDQLQTTDANNKEALVALNMKLDRLLGKYAPIHNPIYQRLTVEEQAQFTYKRKDFDLSPSLQGGVTKVVLENNARVLESYGKQTQELENLEEENKKVRAQVTRGKTQEFTPESQPHVFKRSTPLRFERDYTTEPRKRIAGVEHPQGERKPQKEQSRQASQQSSTRVSSLVQQFEKPKEKLEKLSSKKSRK